MIIKVTTNKGTSNIEVASIGNAMAFMNAIVWPLSAPIKIDGNPAPVGTINYDGFATVEIDGNSYAGIVMVQVEVTGGYLTVKKSLVNDAMTIKASDVQDAPHSLSAIHGSFGPFDYNIDVHLDTSDYSQSYFYIELSIWGIHLINAHLDANNPKVTIDASVLGAGVEGTLGVDFNSCRVYVDITLKYIIDQKTYSFDIYNWSNCKTEHTLLPAKEGAPCLSAAANGDSGYISVYSTGAYVAKFTLDYTFNGTRMSQESDSITAGVTKTLDIPAGATDITLHVKDAVFFGAWSPIFSKHFDTPVCKKYHIWGTTLDTDWEEC